MYEMVPSKEVKVSESYMNQRPEIRKCQDAEEYDACITRHYINAVITSCGCLPLKIRISNKVPSIVC